MTLLSPKEAAAALGVSESSLKRWCDRGELPAVKTAGGHRRLETATVVDYARRSGRQIVRPGLLGLGPGGRTRKSDDPAGAFLEALLSGDAAGGRFLARASFVSGMSVAEWGDRFVATAFREIGERWEHGAAEVYQERRACRLCHGVLEDLGSLLPAAAGRAPLAIGAAVEGDPYTLATSLVEVVLRQLGWRAQSLGNNLPWSTLIAAARDLKPRLFWLSVSTIADEEEFIKNYAAFFDAVGTQTAVVVGGRAWTSELRARLRYAAYCDRLQHLEAFAATLFRPRKGRDDAK